MTTRNARRATFALLIALALGSVPGPAAGRTTVKLTTLAPRDSSYHQALQRMGEAWRKASGGEVDVIIYPGGIQGGEAAMVKRMRIGQIQAGLLTAVGLALIEPAVTGLQSMPMMFRSLEEVDHVGSVLQPTLEPMLAAKGFVVLFWTDTGWVRYFSRQPMRVPDDLRRLKMFSWASASNEDDIAQRAGFKTVRLESADILPGLQTGLIDVVAMPPFFALSSQIYTAASHTLDLDWAPLVGACVIDLKTWQRCPEGAREEMMKAAREAGAKIKESARRESREALDTMCTKWGMKRTAVPDDVRELWRKGFEAIYPQIRGRIVPADIWDKAVAALQEYRAGGAAKPPAQ